jgi:hypothetical protein
LQICNAVAVSLERDRRGFLENCQKIAEAKWEDNAQPIDAVSGIIDGPADLAVRSYQLMQATRLISVQQYISPPEGRDFADLLWAQVCGTHMDDVLELVERYKPKREDEEERFGFDVARGIIGDTPFPPWAVALMVEIMMQTPQLTGHTAMIVAAAFGDEENVQCVRAQLERKH